MKLSTVLVAPILAVATMLLPVGESNVTVSFGRTVFGVLNNTPDLNAFSQLIVTGGLNDVLSNKNKYFTVFAPVNAAVNNLSNTLLNKIESADFKPHLVNLLEYHVVKGAFMSQDLENGRMQTLNGESVNISINPGVHINNASLIATDAVAENGVIQSINKVLTPAWVHRNAMDFISARSNFSTLVSLVKEVGLGSYLQTMSPITVFAPTNDAFQASIGSQGLAKLRNDTSMLRKILLYHITSGVKTAAMLANEGSTTMENGITAHVSIKQVSTPDTSISSAPIINPDNLVNNGIVQIMGAVMAFPTGSAPTAAPTSLGATSTAAPTSPGTGAPSTPGTTGTKAPTTPAPTGTKAPVPTTPGVTGTKAPTTVSSTGPATPPPVPVGQVLLTPLPTAAPTATGTIPRRYPSTHGSVPTTLTEFTSSTEKTFQTTYIVLASAAAVAMLTFGV